MKKQILVLSLIALASCTYNDRKISLNLNIEQNQHTISKATALKISVVEYRQDPQVIGTKKIGDAKVNLTSDQNLAIMLHDKISQSLFAQGFKKGNDKQLEFRIEEFRFKAERHFFIGKSDAEAKIKAIITDAKGNVKFTKTFELSLKNKHFIASFETTDEETINQLLNDVAQDIVSDKSLLENLVK